MKLTPFPLLYEEKEHLVSGESPPFLFPSFCPPNEKETKRISWAATNKDQFLDLFWSGKIASAAAVATSTLNNHSVTFTPHQPIPE